MTLIVMITADNYNYLDVTESGLGLKT